MPLALAEKAVALDGGTAKYHRQVAEVLGVIAQHSNSLQQLFLARRFRKEIDIALKLNPRDVQANRDLLEFYLLAPGIAGGSRREAIVAAERIARIDAAEGYLAKARIASLHPETGDQELLLRNAAKAEPTSYRAQMAAAEFYLGPAHRNHAAAEAAARRAVELDPGRTDGYAALAAVYAERGAWDELETTLAESRRHSPDDLYPQYRAAEVLIARGMETDRADRYLRAYLAQEPEGNRPPLADARRLLHRPASGRRTQ